MLAYYALPPFLVSTAFAWDSAAELVALAMNSSPKEILQKTCAGIIGRQALNTPVRVSATIPGHLELAGFDEIKDPTAQVSRLVMDQKYEKLTGHDDNEHEEPQSTAQETLRLRERAVAQSKE